ncbi:At1g47710 [Linum grandiflorum]
MNSSIRVAMQTILDQIQLGSGEAAKNVVVSPASLDIALCTAANGTKGKTLEQLLRFLGAQDIDDLNAKASKTMEVLRLASPENNPPVPEREKDRFYEFYKYAHVPANVSCANAAWIDGRYSVKDSFKQILADVYRAETNSVDFLHQRDEAVKEINSWAEKSTNGRVNNLLTRENINDYTALVLTNAIYLKALWTSKFFKREGEKFYLLDGTNTVSVPFIYSGKMESSFRYASFEEFKVLEVPYQTGRQYQFGKRDERPCFSMYFFLPHEVDGLPAMLRKFDGSTEELSQTLGGLEYVHMNKVAIPMWKSSYGFNPKETMKRMGLKLPFEMNEDFTKMLDNGSDVCISDVIQSAYINVDENGTEAGAATAVVHIYSSPGCPRTRPEDEFVADHPFMYMIVERDSKTVIFTGAVFNPVDGLQ